MHIVNILDMLTIHRRKFNGVKFLFDDWLANCTRKGLGKPGLSISPILVKLEDMTVDEVNYSICHFITDSTCR